MKTSTTKNNNIRYNCEKYSAPTVEVPEEFWHVEELWNELLDVTTCAVDGVPGTRDGEELSVGIVKSGE